MKITIPVHLLRSFPVIRSVLLVAAFTFISPLLYAQSDTDIAQETSADDQQVMEATDAEGSVEEIITPDQPKTTSSSTEKKITTIDLKGEIESIDVDGRTFSVEGKTFEFLKSGKVFFKRKQKSLADLKVGDRVAVTYRIRSSDGALIASRINK